MSKIIIKNVLFNSNRLKYKEVDISDSKFLTSLMTNPETMKYIPNKYKEESEIKEMIKTIIEDRKLRERTVYFFIIIEKEKNVPIGIVNLKRLNIDSSEQGILGYIIKKEYWGNGYATEATRSIMKY